MDFQTLARRDLQFLCKKNRIPANTTNAAMANALQALDAVEGIEEMQSKLGLQSVKSPELPRSSRSSSSREATPGIETKMQVSPLPRSRRVTAKALEIVDMSLDEKEERRDLPEQTLETPAAFRSRRKMTRGRAGSIASTPASNRAVPLPPALQDDLDEKEGKRDVPEQTIDTPAAIRSTRKITRGRAGSIASTPASKRTVPLPPALQDDLDEKEEKRDVPEQTLDTPAARRSTRKMTRGRAGSIASTTASKRTVPLPPPLQDDLDDKEEKRDVPEQTLDAPAASQSMRKMTRGGVESIASTPASKRTVPLPPALQDHLDEKEEKRDVLEQTLDTPAASRSTRMMTRGRAGSIASTPASKRTVPLPPALQDDLDDKEEKRDVPEQTLDTPTGSRSVRKMTRGRAASIASTPASKRTVPLPPALEDDLDDKEEKRDVPEQTPGTRGTNRSMTKMTRRRSEAIASTLASKATVPLRPANRDDLHERKATRDMPEQTLDTPAVIRSTRKMTRGGAEDIASTPVSKTTVSLLQANEDDLDQKEETRDVPEQTLDTLETIQSTRTMIRGRAEAIASTPASKRTVPLRPFRQDDLDEKEDFRSVPEQTLDTPGTRKMTKGKADAVASTPVSKRTVPLRSACQEDSEANYLGITYRRSSSLSLRKQAEEMTDVYCSRRSSIRAAEAVKMATLAQEEATEEEKEIVDDGGKNYEEAEIQDSSSCLDEETTSKVVAVIGSPEEEERVVLEESPVMGLVSSDANSSLVLKDSNNQTLANETPLGDFSSSKNKQTISASPSEQAFSSIDGFCGVREEEEEEKELGQLLTDMTLADSEEGKITQDASFISERPASELPKEETKFTKSSSESQDVTFDTNGPNAPTGLCEAFNDPAREPVDVSKESEAYKGGICDVLQAAEEASGPVVSAVIDLSHGPTMTGGDVATVFPVSADKTPGFSQDASFQPKIAVISTEIHDESSAVNNLRAITAETTEATEEISADDSSGEFRGEGVHELSGDSTTMSTTSISSIVQTESPGSEVGDSAAVEREQWLTRDHLKSLSLRKLKALLKQKQKEDKWRTKSVMKTEEDEMENKEPLIETAELQVSMENIREDKKAKMENKEPLIKTAELQVSMENFRDDKKAKMENKEPLIKTAELQVSMENFREDKKAKTKNTESEIKKGELVFCKEKFSEDKAKEKDSSTSL